MNKEEIEEAKEHYIFTTKHILDDSNKRLKEYIKYLEQKESILDKVKDKLEEIRRELDNDGGGYYAQDFVPNNMTQVELNKYIKKMKDPKGKYEKT